VPEAIAHGVKLSGVTVHFLDAEVDHGPIILQESVPVLPDDSEETLHARIQQVEHRVYPEVVAAFATGRLRIDSRLVHWEDGA
jgi:phosphoribosylglycinamide formyltransferase-1